MKFFWWKVTHKLPYHGDIITEVFYVYARNTLEIIDIIFCYVHPARILHDYEFVEFEKVEEEKVDKNRVFTNQREGEGLRNRLVLTALEWQEKFGVAPQIISSISEYDASKLIGMSYEEYQEGVNKTAVTKGYDFRYQGVRYQVKACRPSGKRGSKITRVPKPKNHDWDKLIWIMYDKEFQIEEAWLWELNDFISLLDDKERITPQDMRNGKNINY